MVTNSITISYLIVDFLLDLLAYHGPSCTYPLGSLFYFLFNIFPYQKVATLVGQDCPQTIFLAYARGDFPDRSEHSHSAPVFMTGNFQEPIYISLIIRTNRAKISPPKTILMSEGSYLQTGRSTLCTALCYVWDNDDLDRVSELRRVHLPRYRAKRIKPAIPECLVQYQHSLHRQ